MTVKEDRNCGTDSGLHSGELNLWSSVPRPLSVL